MSSIDQICAEAAKLFARHGFESVTMRHVAEACNVTTGGVYYHFQSKEELLEEVTQLKFAEFYNNVVRAWESADQQTPSNLIGLMFDEAVKEPTFFLLMQHDLHHYDEGPRLVRSRKRYLRFSSLFREALEHRSRHGDPEADVIILSALIGGLCELTYADQRAWNQDRDVVLKNNREAVVRHVKHAFD